MEKRSMGALAWVFFVSAVACSSSSPTSQLGTPSSGVDSPPTTGTGVVTPGDGNSANGNTVSNSNVTGNANTTGNGNTTALTDLLTGTGSGNGQATFQGTVDKTAFSPASAAFDVLGSGGNGDFLVVVFSSDAAICSAMATNKALPKSATLTTAIFTNLDPNGNAQTLNPNGSYTISSSQKPPTGAAVDFSFFSLDASCAQSLADAYTHGSSGSFNLSQVTLAGSGTATGTFAVEMGTQSDAVSGTFTAVSCPGLALQVIDPNGQACQ